MALSPLVLYAVGCGGDPFAAEDPATSADPPRALQDAASDALDAPARDASGAEAALDVDADAGEDGGPDVADAHDAADAAVCPCVNDLGGAGLADLYVAFDVQTTASGGMGIVNQDACTASAFWTVHTGVSAGVTVVYVAVGAGSGTFNETAGAQPVGINDGLVHHVVVARTAAGTSYTVTVDGAPSVATGMTPEPLPSGLPPLAVGKECGQSPLAGSLTGVCLSIGCALH